MNQNSKKSYNEPQPIPLLLGGIISPMEKIRASSNNKMIKYKNST
jgi:hypothetical protein